MKLDPILMLYTKIDAIWIKHLSLRAKTVKPLRRKQRKIFMTLNLAMISWITPKTQATKEKRDELDFIKIKTFVLQIKLSRK